MTNISLESKLHDEVICVALVDIKACFRISKIDSGLTGAFGFTINNVHCLVINDLVPIYLYPVESVCVEQVKD